VAPADRRLDPAAMTALGDALYIFERSGALYARIPRAASFSSRAAWRDPRAAVRAAERSTRWTAARCYRVDPRNGSWQQLDGSWDTARMAALDGALVHVGAATERCTARSGWCVDSIRRLVAVDDRGRRAR